LAHPSPQASRLSPSSSHGLAATLAACRPHRHPDTNAAAILVECRLPQHLGTSGVATPAEHRPLPHPRTSGEEVGKAAHLSLPLIPGRMEASTTDPKRPNLKPEPEVARAVNPYLQHMLGSMIPSTSPDMAAKEASAFLQRMAGVTNPKASGIRSKGGWLGDRRVEVGVVMDTFIIGRSRLREATVGVSGYPSPCT